jgi:hypothetical protein
MFILNKYKLFHQMLMLLLLLLMHIVYSIINFVNLLNVSVHCKMVLHVVVMHDYHLSHQNFHHRRPVLTNQAIVLSNQLHTKRNKLYYLNSKSNIQSCGFAESNVRHKASYCLDTRNDA